jgi:hypothetical protein
VAREQGEAGFWRLIKILSEVSGPVNQVVISAATGQRPGGSSMRTADAIAARLQSDRLLALSLSIRATPTIFVNGLWLQGEVGRAKLERAIMYEQAEVAAWLHDRVPAAQIYSRRVEVNLLDLLRD